MQLVHFAKLQFLSAYAKQDIFTKICSDVTVLNSVTILFSNYGSSFLFSLTFHLTHESVIYVWAMWKQRRVGVIDISGDFISLDQKLTAKID